MVIGLVCAVLCRKPEIPPEVQTDPWKVTRHEATCETAGYTMRENIETGIIEIQDEVPALGHNYGDWTTDKATGGSVRTCSVCGQTQTQLPSAQIDLPEIHLEGNIDGISKENRVILRASVQDNPVSFDCYAYTSWQGHSTLDNEKKNYTIRLFYDEAITNKYRLEMRPGWQLEHKYVLKANYADATQVRNLLCADVWAQMAATRAGMEPRLAATSNYGATDGFPVTVWLNDEFHGLYTLNLHKDDDLYSMKKGWTDAVMICNGSAAQESMFRAETNFTNEENGWEVEFCGTDDTSWAEDSFNKLIRFVMTADDEAFRNQLKNHMDVDSGIDYLLFMYAMGLTNNDAKDLVMLSYENGPWIASVYDMETAFGLAADGASASSADAFRPEKNDGIWHSGTDNLLWDRMLNAFEPQIISRWQDLRQNVLTEENLTMQLKALQDQVPTAAIERDLALYSARETITEPHKQMEEYIQQRLPLLDTVFAASQE